ncbi:MAG: hypothetical protein ACFFCD_16775 [Promethearchaeota archaeon]
MDQPELSMTGLHASNREAKQDSLGGQKPPNLLGVSSHLWITTDITRRNVLHITWSTRSCAETNPEKPTSSTTGMNDRYGDEKGDITCLALLEYSRKRLIYSKIDTE